MIIYLADLDYFTEGNRIETPLGIGFIKSYCQSTFPEIEFALFKNPDNLITAIEQRPPNILGLSCFIWNMKLNEKLIEICPNSTLIVAGGPNSRLCTKADCIVVGQGEKAFAEILNDYPDVRRYYSKDEFADPPSPYLDGTLDGFMDLLPIVETVRGCPHKCSYCSGGTGKINIRDEQVVKEEIDYLSTKSKHKAIDLSDTNFGICGDRDLRIIQYIRDKYKESGFPYLAGTATSRSKSEIATKVTEIISEITGHLYLGLQTLTEKSLAASSRKNIQNEELANLINKGKKANRPICVDLIFGLPYETRDSFLETLSKLFKMGINSPAIYQLRLLPFTDFWENRDKYGFITKFRPFNGRYGKVGGERLVEAEEIVVESKWFNLEDYFVLREVGLFITLMSGYGVFREIFTTTKSPMSLIEAIRRKSYCFPQLSAWLKQYREYTKKELFNTPEEVYDCSPENLFKLNLGFVGYAIFEDRRILNDIGQIINAKARPAPRIKNTYSELPVYNACERILLYSPRKLWQ